MNPFKNALQKTLSQEEEFSLIENYKKNNDKRLLEKLMNAHSNLVTSIAFGYKGYGLPVNDLISEGNIGLMNALKKFDPTRGFKFSTYAVWWIKAAMKSYIFSMSSLVTFSKSGLIRRLFFKLGSEKKRNEEEFSEKSLKDISEKYSVSKENVVLIDRYRKHSDQSLDKEIGDESGAQWIDWVKDESSCPEVIVAQKIEETRYNEILEEAVKALNMNERKVIKERHLLEDSKKTFDELAKELSLSKERIRQIEKSAIKKMKFAIEKYFKEKGYSFGFN